MIGVFETIHALDTTIISGAIVALGDYINKNKNVLVAPR